MQTSRRPKLASSAINCNNTGIPISSADQQSRLVLVDLFTSAYVVQQDVVLPWCAALYYSHACFHFVPAYATCYVC